MIKNPNDSSGVRNQFDTELRKCLKKIRFSDTHELYTRLLIDIVEESDITGFDRNTKLSDVISEFPRAFFRFNPDTEQSNVLKNIFDLLEGITEKAMRDRLSHLYDELKQSASMPGSTMSQHKRRRNSRFEKKKLLGVQRLIQGQDDVELPDGLLGCANPSNQYQRPDECEVVFEFLAIIAELIRRHSELPQCVDFLNKLKRLCEAIDDFHSLLQNQESKSTDDKKDFERDTTPKAAILIRIRDAYYRDNIKFVYQAIVNTLNEAYSKINGAALPEVDRWEFFKSFVTDIFELDSSLGAMINMVNIFVFIDELLCISPSSEEIQCTTKTNDIASHIQSFHGHLKVVVEVFTNYNQNRMVKINKIMEDIGWDAGTLGVNLRDIGTVLYTIRENTFSTC